MGKQNGQKFRTIEQKEVLQAYGNDVIHRKLLHSLNIIANQLAKGNGDNQDIQLLLENIRILDLASKGLVEVDEVIDAVDSRKGLLKSFFSFAVSSGGD